jgi:hypothetical protein
MKMPRPRAALAVVLSLLLLVAQQTAFAHLLGHLDGGPAPAGRHDTCAQQGHPDGPCSALNLSHGCATCVSLAGLAFAVAVPALPPLAGDRAYTAPAFAPPATPVAVDPHPYRARAPPAVL